MKRILFLLVAISMAFTSAQELNWITGNSAIAVESATAQAEAYMAMNPGVTITVIQGPESATDRAQQYLQFFEAQSGEVDIFEIDVIWPGDMAEHLVNLYEYPGFEDAVGDFFPAIVANNTVDGNLVGMPFYTDAGLLYYRTDLLEEYGFEAPTTWADLTAAAQAIQDGERAKGNEDFTGFVWQGNAYEGLTCDALEWVTSNGGGEIVEVQADGSKLITINNENAVAALELAASWVGTISPAGVTGFQEEDARNIWQAGNAAFMRNWPYAYSLGNGDDSAVAGNFGVAALPMGSAEGARNAGTLGGWQLAVSTYSDSADVAADFVLWLTNEDNQLDNAIGRSLLPTRTALYQDERLLASDSAFMAEFLPVFEGAVARPSTATAPNYLQVSQRFFSAVHSVLTGEEDAETALALLELDLQDITGYATQ